MDASRAVHHRRPRRVAGGLPLLPWRRLVNPFRPVEILSADHVEAIHRGSLRILAEIGMEVMGDRALDAFAGAGAQVDRLTRNVRLDPEQVEALVALAPPEFTLHARNPERNIIFGGTHLVFGAVGGPAFVSDLDRGRRAGNAADFVDYVRLIGTLDIIHQEGGGPLEPTDLPVETRHLDMYRIFATELDKTWQCLGFGATPVDDALEVLQIIRGVDRDALVREPSAMTIINTNSPLRLDGPMGDGLPDNPLTPWLPAFSPSVIGILGAIDAIGSLSLPLAAGLGVAAIIVRFRRSQGDQRQQLKWFLAAMAPAAVLLPLSLSEATSSFPLIDLLSVAMLPLIAVSVAIAILRYRLYDIDRFISRTISYGLVTALLISVFLVVNLGLQGLLSDVTSGNSLAVAGSTLLAAALFTPVRQRVQRIVDRRFDRARYDGERTASAFSVRMRDATDLPTVAHDLNDTVRRAIAPSSVGLWLRGGGR